jgi:2-oxo-4-hydroxy-4-carboxy-5-ureidoimidazoline decarboxylase
MLRRDRHDAAAGNECWRQLRISDWLEAFAHHPRIGERVAGREASEQAGAQSAEDSVRAELRDVNRQYEERFGHIYIVCASGKSAEELLGIARARLVNDPDIEINVAAEELRKIMNLRLESLLDEHN